MWKFKASKYKNAAPKIPKNKEEWITNISANALPQTCGNYIAASESLMAFQIDTTAGGLGVLPVADTGRKETSMPTLKAHSDYVTDFSFSPFDDHLLATGSQDCTVKIWKIPEGGLEDHSPLNPEVNISRGNKRVDTLAWHPTAAGLLALSAGKGVKVCHVEKAEFTYDEEIHDDQVQGMCWRGNGKVLASTGKDKKLKIIDPRAATVAQETNSHGTNRDSRVVWLGDRDYLLTTGFDVSREREVKLRDVRKLSSSLCTNSMGSSTGVVMPFFDPDTNMLFLAGKADTSIHFWEFTEKTPFLTEASADIVEQIKGLAMVPKLAMTVMDGEVNRLLLLTKNAVVPVPYIVPRKSYTEFHSDLYPDTLSNEPALSADQWLAGQDAQRTRISMDPSKRCQGDKAKTTKPKSTQPPATQQVHSGEVEKEDAASPASDQAASQAQQSHKIEQTTEKHSEPAEPHIPVESKEKSLPEEKQVTEKEKKPYVFTGVRQSKFKHFKGKSAHKSQHIDNVRNLSRSIPGESDMFCANKDRCAVPLTGSGGLVAVLELSQPGKLPDTPLPAVQNGTAVMDFVWDPFDNCKLCVACDDAKIRIWEIPSAGLTETLTEPTVILRGHTEKIYFVRYHPLARDVLASASYDMTVRIWDLKTQQEKISLQGHTDTIQCFAWSPDGTRCVTVCKDGKVRMYEPRKSSQPIQEGAGPEGVRGSRVVWVCSGKLLVISGFNKMSTRVLYVYSTDDLSQPVSRVEVDTSPSILIPHHDEDSSTIFLTGRGDSLVHAYEASEEAPHLFQMSSYKADSLHQALSFLPKSEVNVRQVEFAKALRLTQNSVEPVSFTVPRVKMEYFQDDLFPDTKVTWEPTVTSEEWFGGMDRQPRTISLRPDDMKLLSEAPEEAPKPKKFESFQEETYKSDDQKKEELMQAMTAKLELDTGPLPQDLTEGVNEDEWDDY